MRLGSAVDSDIAAIVIVVVPTLAIYMVTRFEPALLLAFLPVAGYLNHYNYLMKNNPGLLRTEKHEENMLQMQLGVGLGRKGDESTEEVNDKLESTSDIQSDPPLSLTEAKPKHVKRGHRK